MSDYGGSRKKIFFIIPALYSGGAERVFLHLVNYLDRKKFEITLVILLTEESHYSKQLPTDIEVMKFGLGKTKNSFFKLIWLLRTRKPDVVFSTLSHLNLILSVVRLFVSGKTKFIVRESNTISSSYKNEKAPWLFKLLFKTTYRHHNLIISQSHYMTNDLIANFGVKKEKIRTIYNPVDTGIIQRSISGEQLPHKAEDKINLLCVGRLAPQKGHDRLLKIMSRLGDFPYHLRIVGDGVLRAQLEALATSLKLSNVEFLGIQENPFQYMAISDCLLLPSYYEGLPNVVIEANVCGLPVIAFNSPGGTSEIITNDFNGWLVDDNDVEAFARLIKSKCYLSVDKKRISSEVAARFASDKIIHEYERAISSLD